MVKIIQKYNVLFQNITSLSFLQLSDYLFPLFSFPYLVRVLGPDGYGLVSFVVAFVAYFANLTEFGFTFSATHQISLLMNEDEKVRKYFWIIIIIKFLLFGIGLIIFTSIILTFDKFYSNYEIYYISYFSILGAIIFPNWFYQAIEKMSFIVLINVISKLLWLISIFLFIKKSEDIIIYVILNSLLSIVIGICGLFVAIYKLKMNFYLPKIDELVKVLNQSKYLFFQRISAMLYTNSNIFLLGLFFNNEVVGYFTAVDKIRMAVQGLLGTITQSMYPFLTKLFEKSFLDAKIFISKYLFKSIIINITIALVFIFYSEEIVLIVLGKQYLSAVNVFRILILAPAIIWISNVLGIQIMLSLGFQRQFFKISMYASFLHILILPISIFSFSVMGVAVAIIMTEAFIAINQYLFLKRKKYY